jgi:polyhydroxybutyrate depolymerase
MRASTVLALLLLTIAMPASGGETCGGPVACVVPTGRYLALLPPGDFRGVLGFFHGYQSSAERMRRNDALIAAAHRAGFALVLPDGMGGSWSFPNSPSAARDDVAFVEEVLDDLDARFGLGSRPVIVSGFSMGASMAYHAVCAEGRRIAGAVTVAGVFWNPLPQSTACAGPVPPMVHIHGKADRTFPLTGRQIGQDHRQGDTRKSIALLRDLARCSLPSPAAIGTLACEVSSCANGGPVALCLHDGGHELRTDWIASAMRFLGH